MNIVRHELGFSKTESGFPAKGTCLAIYSRVVNAEAALEEVLKDQFPWCWHGRSELRELFAAYVEAKQIQNVLDYDDLLLYWAHDDARPGPRDDRSAAASTMSLSTNTRTPTACRPRSSCAEARPGRGLTVVGDDAQSIYSFRAATVRNILDFPNEFRRRPTSSRSTATIARPSRSSPRPTR
jgi:DNA helicase-2/ATP-dependent DNA helicase PcrA